MSEKTKLQAYGTVISWFLGVSMFMVGTLKFVNPFRGWYSQQILHSGLGDTAYVLGIAGEIAVGVLLIFALVKQKQLSASTFKLLVAGASVMTVGMMATGIYVHLHPAVPGDVLPLRIKPPYIPGMFLVLAAINAYIHRPFSRR